MLLFDPLPGEPDLAVARRRGAPPTTSRRYVPIVDGDALRVEPGDVDPALLDVVVVPGLAFTPVATGSVKAADTSTDS